MEWDGTISQEATAENQSLEPGRERALEGDHIGGFSGHLTALNLIGDHRDQRGGEDGHDGEHADHLNEAETTAPPDAGRPLIWIIGTRRTQRTAGELALRLLSPGGWLGNESSKVCFFHRFMGLIGL